MSLAQLFYARQSACAFMSRVRGRSGSSSVTRPAARFTLSVGAPRSAGAALDCARGTRELKVRKVVGISLTRWSGLDTG